MKRETKNRIADVCVWSVFGLFLLALAWLFAGDVILSYGG